MNSMQLKDKLKKISKQKNIDFNILLRLYMYDRFIERLSMSKYKDNFILKGGFYLSTLFGVESRSTMDIDTAFKNDNFTKGNITKMIKEIISVNIDDNAILKCLSITPIMDNEKYGGFRITIIVEIENIKEMFHIDIATGDPITPGAITYKYKPILGDKTINLWAYNIETVLAEKLETIFSRVELNGRMRDYYDAYLIYTRNWDSINKNNFRNAVQKTFEKRNFKGDINNILNILKQSEILQNRWNIYNKKYEYAKNITYKEVLECIEQIVNILELETI